MLALSAGRITVDSADGMVHDQNSSSVLVHDTRRASHNVLPIVPNAQLLLRDRITYFACYVKEKPRSTPCLAARYLGSL